MKFLKDMDVAADPTGRKPVLRVLDGMRETVPPVWLMRQAGRYLPEYRALRQKAGGFLDLCLTPALAAEATLQPVRRFDFDAAILFSDILIVPLAMGRSVCFAEGEGPRLEPLTDAAALAAVQPEADLRVLERVYETVHRVKAALGPRTTFIGFCGAPWTVATYMVAGRGSADQAAAKALAAREPQAFQHLIDGLVDVSVEYLAGQLAAGVEAVQIFDTWAGSLAGADFDRWCVGPTRRLIAALRARCPDAKVIGFPRGAGKNLLGYVRETDVDAVSLDSEVDRDFARHEIQPLVPLQGNVDPRVLVAGGEALDREVDDVLARLGQGPLVVNLGHGILPETPIAHVERMLKRIRG